MEMDLTFPGGGGGGRSSRPPPPPAPLPEPPKRVDARQAIAQRGRIGGTRRDASIRNVGGGRGVEIMGSVATALKTLTGQ